MTSRAPKLALTAEQKALVRSVPGLVERAAHEVRRRFGAILAFEELVAIGHLAVALASQTYDPGHERRVPFQQWAFYRALEAMLTAGRAEKPHRRVVRAVRAGLRFAALEHRAVDRDVFSETDQALFDELTDLADGCLTAMLDVLHAPLAADPESNVLEDEARATTDRALEAVIAELAPDERDLLRLRFAEDLDVKEIARARGVPYWTLLRRHHDLLKRMQRRLRQLGVSSAPGAELSPRLQQPTNG